MTDIAILALSAALGAFLVCALLGLIHRKLGYRRADGLTAAAFAAFAAFCFFIDPLPRVIGKESLYLAFSAAAALLVFIGLKLDEHFKNPWTALIAVPLLAGILASTVHVTVHLSDDADYRPRAAASRRAGPLARALAKTKLLRRKR